MNYEANHRHMSAGMEEIMNQFRDALFRQTCDVCGKPMMSMVAEMLDDWVTEREIAAVEGALAHPRKKSPHTPTPSPEDSEPGV